MAYVTFYVFDISVVGQVIRSYCRRYSIDDLQIQRTCITCAELLSDETACNNDSNCVFDRGNGVCVITSTKWPQAGFVFMRRKNNDYQWKIRINVVFLFSFSFSFFFCGLTNIGIKFQILMKCCLYLLFLFNFKFIFDFDLYLILPSRIPFISFGNLL